MPRQPWTFGMNTLLSPLGVISTLKALHRKNILARQGSLRLMTSVPALLYIEYGCYWHKIVQPTSPGVWSHLWEEGTYVVSRNQGRIRQWGTPLHGRVRCELYSRADGRESHTLKRIQQLCKTTYTIILHSDARNAQIVDESMPHAYGAVDISV